jgi:hypothetical protein
MDDGTYIKGKGIRLCSTGFKLADVHKLGKMLKVAFGLTYTTFAIGLTDRRSGCSTALLFGLYLPKENMEKLNLLLRPHMHKTMLYKLGWVD